MNLYSNNKYLDDLDYINSLDLPWENIDNRIFAISGSTGMIGSLLVDVIMRRNELIKSNCKIFAIGRNSEKAKKRFPVWWENPLFNFVEADINHPFKIEKSENIDYVLHLASNTHPVQYSSDPIGTIITNVIGTRNMLDLATSKNSKRFIFSSSNEIYGENRGDVETFSEDYCGYIDCNTLRAGYTESKRCGEALCQAYIKQNNLDIVIARLTRSYGPTLLSSDTKALSQFLHKGLQKENIILKSDGTQFYSYLHATDTVSGILYVLLKGENGQAYNFSDEESNIRLKDLAKIIADYSGTKVIFQIPDELESLGYSKVTKALLDNKKLKSLGWNAKYTIKTGIKQTMDILSD